MSDADGMRIDDPGEAVRVALGIAARLAPKDWYPVLVLATSASEGRLGELRYGAAIPMPQASCVLRVALAGLLRLEESKVAGTAGPSALGPMDRAWRKFLNRCVAPEASEALRIASGVAFRRGYAAAFRDALEALGMEEVASKRALDAMLDDVERTGVEP